MYTHTHTHTLGTWWARVRTRLHRKRLHRKRLHQSGRNHGIVRAAMVFGHGVRSAKRHGVRVHIRCAHYSNRRGRGGSKGGRGRKCSIWACGLWGASSISLLDALCSWLPLFLDGRADALDLHTPPRLFLNLFSTLRLAHLLDDLPGLRAESTVCVCVCVCVCVYIYIYIYTYIYIYYIYIYIL